MFLFLHKTGSVGSVDQQINQVSPYGSEGFFGKRDLFPLKLINKILLLTQNVFFDIAYFCDKLYKEVDFKNQ